MTHPDPDPVPMPEPDGSPLQVPSTIEQLDLGERRPNEFEFTPAQERVMAELGDKMRLVGLIGMVVGVLGLIERLAILPRSVRDLPGFLPPVVYFLIGLWTRQAGMAYRRVADTERHDITHLMNGLNAQLRVFRLATGLLVALAVLILILLLWYGLGMTLVASNPGS